MRDVEITQAGRDAFAKVWPTMYDLLLKMFDGIDNEEYKAFTATMHKMMSNVRKHEHLIVPARRIARMAFLRGL